jgi:hypothetical protein
MQRFCRLFCSLVLGFSLGGRSVCSAQPPAGAEADTPSVELAPIAEPVPLPPTILPRGGPAPFMAPQMIGDFSGGFLAGGAFKIADNESPRPVDRLFATYNYFNDVFAPIAKANLHEEVFGFEKALLNGDASIGLRAPVYQTQGDGAIKSSDFGDLSVVFKYVLLNDTMAGNVFSTGLVVTVPTGPDVALPNGTSLHPVLLQPYLGGILHQDRFYIHGFLSLAVPSQSQDAVLLFNDVGIGYRLYQSGDTATFRYVIPTVEAHINTPLTHRGSPQLGIGALEEVVFTYGVHLGLFKKAQLTLGIATPVTGPRPFDFEALAQLNWRF